VSDSIWKKEISFRRKPKRAAGSGRPEPAPKAAPPKQSIWKKEITLGRKKPKEALPPPVAIAPEPEPAPDREPDRLPHAAGDYEWRNDAAQPHTNPLAVEPVLAPMPHNVVQMSPPAAPAAPQPEAHTPEPPATDEPQEPQPTEPKEPKERKPSFLKREIGRKKKPPEAKAAAPEAEPNRKREKAPKAARPPRVSKRGKQLVGLKVGASQVAAARVVNNGAAELVQVARAELPPGLVVGGELRDPDALGDFLRAFFKEHRLPTKGVRLGLSNNRIGVRSFEIAGIHDPKQLANAIRFRAQESLPIPIEEAVLDYRVLGEGRTEEGEATRRILLVVAYRDLVDRYVAACRRAGLTLAGIDLEAFALLRSLAPPRGDDEQTDAAVVAIAVGHERSTLAVSDGRVCEFTRVVEWGGSAINVAIARALDVSPLEAEPVKRALSLEGPLVIEGLTAEQLQAVDEAVRRQVHTFARELVSSLQFYQGQPGSLGIGEIVVTGGTAHLPGLAAELQRLIGVSVRIGNPLGRVRVGKRIAEPEQVGSLAVAIGLGIDD
jgi:type IV pilus assembly protein PilM